jgi:hypothetical protein
LVDWEKQLASAEGAGRGILPRGTAEFAGGGSVLGFGPLSLGDGSGLVRAHLGERVLNPADSMTYGPMIDAHKAGRGTFSALNPLPSSTGSNGPRIEVHLHSHSLEPQNFYDWARRGGAEKIVSAMNSYNGEYAGVANF